MDPLSAGTWTLVCLWFMFAALCALIAKRRDRSAGAWFFLGLFFGVFALIFLVVTGSNYKRCPKCAEDVRKGALVCKHCGYDFGLKPVAATKREVMASTIEKDTITCGNCGHTMRRGFAYCEECRSKLQ